MKFLGIDPGASGGIAVLDTCTNYARVVTHTIPQTESDLYALFATLSPPSKAIIEKVHAMPKQGVTSMFSFGQIYGFKRACLISLGIPFDEVAPKTWQKELGLSFPKGTPYSERKKLARMKAQQLYPGLEFPKECADALLILEFLRRREVGS